MADAVTVQTLPDGTIRHVLRPEPPIGAFVISGVVTLIGVFLLVFSLVTHWSTGWIVFSAILLGLGLLMVAGSIWAAQRMRLLVDLNDEGYRIHGAGQDRSGTWTSVTKAAMTPNRSRLTLYHGQVGRTHIVRPGEGDPAEMGSLAADVARHIDRSHHLDQGR